MIASSSRALAGPGGARKTPPRYIHVYTYVRALALYGATPSYTHSRGSRSIHRGFPTDHSVPMCSTGDKESGNGPTHQPRSPLQVERYRGLHVLRDLLTTTLCVNASGTGALHSYEVQGKPIHNFASASVLARCWSKFT